MAATTHGAASPYQIVNDPADLIRVAQDQASYAADLIWPQLLADAIVEVGAEGDMAGVLSGSLRHPNARSFRNYDPSAPRGVAVDAPLPDADNIFPSDTTNFEIKKYGGKSEKIGEPRLKGYTGAALRAKERGMVQQAALKAWYDVEFELASKLMTAANWQTVAIAALTGGSGKFWGASDGTPVKDSVALFELFADNCGEKPTHYVIPEIVARAMQKSPELQGYLVVASANGTAVGNSGAQGQIVSRSVLQSAIQMMLADNRPGIFGQGGVQVLVGAFRPFVKGKRKTATASDRAWAWNANQVGMYHLNTGGPAIRAGSEFELNRRTGLAMTRFADVEPKFRMTEGGAVYADAYGLWDLPIIDADYGLVATAVLS